ncbi:MAG TPA: hypothetical protein VFT20_08280 [Candidatus Limnocylindrales bacterium]|nr:hypothetical protein [Candidatus Limnocylindrales bacterium]
MHRTRTLGGVVLIATGLVWIGQGTGIIGGGSFMVGDPFWAWLGLVGVVAGIAFIVVDARRPLGPR